MKNSQSGQTIIEAIVALSAILLTISAIAVAVLTGISNSTFVKNQNLGNKYAQQGIEFVRNIKENDINKFINYSGTWCIDESVSPPVLTQEATKCGGIVNAGDTHIREIIFDVGSTGTSYSPCSEKETRITVKASWPSGKCGETDRYCHRSELATCFINQPPEGINPL